jgi:hypothetical protein
MVGPESGWGKSRHGFGYVVEVAERLVSTLKQCGPETAVNIDEAMEREAMDVIGLVGFGKDFGATGRLLQPGEHDPFHNLSMGMLLSSLLRSPAVLRVSCDASTPRGPQGAVAIAFMREAAGQQGEAGDDEGGVAAGANEITLRMMDPLRRYRFWQPVGYPEPRNPTPPLQFSPAAVMGPCCPQYGCSVDCCVTPWNCVACSTRRLEVHCLPVCFIAYLGRGSSWVTQAGYCRVAVASCEPPIS